MKIKNRESVPSLQIEDKIDLNLNIKDSKYKLDRIRVWINDVVIYGESGISVRKYDYENLDTTLTLSLAKGKNKIEISVLNQAGAESYKESIKVECTKGKSTPDLYLITIGVSNFKQSDFNLTYAAKDAKDITKVMKSSNAYRNVYAKTILNDEVTKENILALTAFLEKADINDHVLIFFSGHGLLSTDLEYFLATYDIDFRNPEENGLAYED